jgi:hypothetical protein
MFRPRARARRKSRLPLPPRSRETGLSLQLLGQGPAHVQEFNQLKALLGDLQRVLTRRVRHEVYATSILHNNSAGLDVGIVVSRADVRPQRSPYSSQ